MHILDVRERRSSLENAFFTNPGFLIHWVSLHIPVLSWPRCCKKVNPSYIFIGLSGILRVEMSPITPHIYFLGEKGLYLFV